MINFDIDLVVPFVDNTDPVWRQVYINYCKSSGNIERLAQIEGARFDDFGLFKYCLKGIDKFMP